MTSHEVPSLHDQIAAHVEAAIARVRPELTDVDPLVHRSEHADFQSNAALALAKATRANPRQLADGIATELRSLAGDPIAEVTLSGPGFLNVTVGDDHRGQHRPCPRVPRRRRRTAEPSR